MITCPSCNHQNPEGSLQCENCYTPLPATTSCPNCGASVQTDATFCGQCGFNLQAENSPISTPTSVEKTAIGSTPDIALEELSLPDQMPLSGSSPDILPETAISSMIQSPWDDNETDETIDETIAQNQNLPSDFPEIEPPETEFAGIDQSPPPETANPWQSEASKLDLESESAQPDAAERAKPSIESEQPMGEVNTVVPEETIESVARNLAAMEAMNGATQLQVDTASLLHLQSNTTINIASNLDVVHIGKPNDQIPPDIDVAGFPDSEVVSRVHADIRIEGDAYFVEDVGSSNGTYINHAPLLKGNRHRLRAGDRIALGKGDLVTFIFQLS